MLGARAAGAGKRGAQIGGGPHDPGLLPALSNIQKNPLVHGCSAPTLVAAADGIGCRTAGRPSHARLANSVAQALVALARGEYDMRRGEGSRLHRKACRKRQTHWPLVRHHAREVQISANRGQDMGRIQRRASSDVSGSRQLGVSGQQ